MNKSFKYLMVGLVLCLVLCFLSCTPSSTYLNEAEFEEMRSKCLAAIPDSYSFRFDPPESCYLLIGIDEGESSVEYYFYSGDVPVDRDVLANWIKKYGRFRFANSNAILLDVKTMDDVFTYVKALYEDQLNDYQSSSNGRYLSTQIKYDDEYFFPISFSCDIRKSSFGINASPSVAEPISTTIEDFSVKN